MTEILTSPPQVKRVCITVWWLEEAWLEEVETTLERARAHWRRDPAPYNLSTRDCWASVCVWPMQLHGKDKVTDPEWPCEATASGLNRERVGVYIYHIRKSWKKNEHERKTRDLSQIISNKFYAFDIIDGRYGDDSVRTMEVKELGFVFISRVWGEDFRFQSIV